MAWGAVQVTQLPKASARELGNGGAAAPHPVGSAGT